MSVFAFGIWLVAFGTGILLINAAIWIQLARFAERSKLKNSWARFISSISVMLAFNSWFLGSFLYWEARSVLGTNEAAPVHWMMSQSQGNAIMAASRLIALLSPITVAVGLLLGSVGCYTGLRTEDRGATRIGLIGVLANGLLIALACGLFALRFASLFDRKPDRKPMGNRSSNAQVSRVEPPEDEDWITVMRKRPNWNDEQAVLAFAQPYKDRGYRIEVSQSLKVEAPITRPTIYFGQRIEIRAGSTADITIVAQSGEIHRQVDGDIEFLGQTLRIRRDAVVNGNIVCRAAQSIRIEGKVTGSVSGKYGSLHRDDE